jgi:[ribosomal protein S5]-alanine N-acetyltransferase
MWKKALGSWVYYRSSSSSIKYLFEECKYDVVYAEYMENNVASGRVMQKIGLKYEGIQRSRVIDKLGIRNNLISYSLTRDEYEKQNATI